MLYVMPHAEVARVSIKTNVQVVLQIIIFILDTVGIYVRMGRILTLQICSVWGVMQVVVTVLGGTPIVVLLVLVGSIFIILLVLVVVRGEWRPMLTMYASRGISMCLLCFWLYWGCYGFEVICMLYFDDVVVVVIIVVEIIVVEKMR